MSTPNQAPNNAPQPTFRRGGPRNLGAPVEKAQNRSRTFRRLIAYFRPETGRLVILFICVTVGAAASIIAPTLQSGAIDSIAAKQFDALPRFLILMIIMYGLTVWITWISAERIDSGTLQVGTMTAFIAYAMEIVFSFLMIASMAIFLPRAGIAADRVYEVLETETSITGLMSKDGKEYIIVFHHKK